ncbi:MAG: TrmH family RNA methyltransferase [bacterium JZ-2024 1]
MPFQHLTSSANPRVLHARKLAGSASFRRHSGETLLEGRKIIQDAIARNVPLSAIFVSRDFADKYELWLSEAIKAETSVYIVPDALLKKVSSLETPDGIVAVASLRIFHLHELSVSRWGVVLDGIQDPGNAGAIARTALAFGAQCVLFTRGSVDPLHPRTLRGSMGALLAIPFVSVTAEELLDWASRNRVILIGTHPHRGVSLPELSIRPPFLVVLGSEGQGVSPGLGDRTFTWVRIHTESVESLPVVGAAGIIFYELSQKMGPVPAQ